MLLQPPAKLWHCPSCEAMHETREARPHVPMHNCPALHGCSIPFLETGADGRVRVVEREDYVGDAIAHVVNGRAIQAVHVDRADGSNDCFAFADTATVQINN